MNDEICGIGRCTKEPDQGRIWSVPICAKHWAALCRDTEATGASLDWLHAHAKAEHVAHLPALLKSDAEPAVRVAKPFIRPRVRVARPVR